MRFTVIRSLILCVTLGWAKAGAADPSCKTEQRATLVSLQGTVFFDADSKGQWRQAQLDEAICQHGRVKVETYSRASLSLPNGVVLRLDAGTILSLHDITRDEPTALDLLKGFIHFISRTPKHLEITSPIANAGPEGTEFAMKVDDSQASLWVYEGAVRFFNPQGSIRLSPGQGADALAGQAPRSQIEIKPQDAVNWALYYPPLLPYPKPSAKIDASLRIAIEDFRKGRVDQALIRLDALAPAQRTPYFFKVRGAVRLTVGRVALAREDIRSIFATNPNDAEALALLSVLALTQNRKEEALQLANKAVASDPASPTAYSALSYAEQGRFELDKALAAAEKATQYAPHDAIVWARKAELQLAQGVTTDSEHAARRAQELDPGLERTQTVTGFSYLLRMETAAAKQAFEQAVKLDSTSPLARLGLGLAKIRDGNLEEGRHDLEIAAILDPNNSLTRSYLGKAYYEEKRNILAEDQFRLAKERDPKDPTPYFYDAINKQTTNRPVEALYDIQKAIVLNDNRAVYRSSLHLDKDLAARSAAQGRIYNELSFQQLGLLEGWKSVNKDSSNYSAHRLLADNYAGLPRHEFARVSELLQSQLLQPINITPIHPNLAENNLLILNSLGPSDLSYNEFNPLFEYNRLAFQASGYYGSNDTKGDNVTLSGLHDNVSFSLGQFHFDTDGFRENNFIKKNLYNAFLQSKITDNLNLQAELRHEDRSNGDLSLNFSASPDVFSTKSHLNTNVTSYRVGGNYLITPHSSVIGSLIYQDVNIETTNDNEDITLTKRNGFISELQNIYTHSNLSSVIGFSHINQSSTRQDSPQEAPQDTSLTKTNIYNYSKYNINDSLQTTLGLSIYFFNRTEGRLERNRINPKFGIVWTPTVSTTFRAAAFRSMSLAQVASQTIEPTQVAGFNQFFDDFINGTVTWRFGAGIDHKVSKNVITGLEYTERKLDFPGTKLSLDRSEQLGRAYIYFTPIDQLSLSGEYYFERIDQSNRPMNDLTGRFLLVETHRIPLTISLFHPSGLSLKIRNSFIHQTGLFSSCIHLECNELSMTGGSSFDVVDLNLSYRLPKRYGIIGFGVNNLFDEHFNFQNTSANSNVNPTDNILSPSRFVYSRFTVAF